jgi:hypothetical protein
MPKYLLIDGLEKMNVADQTSLLHLMQIGIISETKMKKTRELKLTSRVLATANSCKWIIAPLLSRFVVLDVPEYTYLSGYLQKRILTNNLLILAPRRFGMNLTQRIPVML